VATRSYYTNVASPSEGYMLRVSLSAKRDHLEGYLDLFRGEHTTVDEHAAVISEGGPSEYRLAVDRDPWVLFGHVSGVSRWEAIAIARSVRLAD
jgi:hypothetical protein